MPARSIKVFEHSQLLFDNSERDTAFFKSLVKYNERHEGKFFRVGNRKITFNSYVGVIQIGNNVLEILPKADAGPASPEAVGVWQRTLLQMLKTAGYIRNNPANSANQHIQNSNLMDIYLLTFLQEVVQLVHAGLIKKYIRVRSNGNVLKGKLLVEKQMQYNLMHEERFYTEHTRYSRNAVHNQVLKAALDIVSKTTTNKHVKLESRKLLLYFEDVELWNGNKIELGNIIIDRKWKTYQPAMELAKLILLNHSPAMRVGDNYTMAILFDMNRLFEKYVYRILKKKEPEFRAQRLRISYQESISFWENRYLQPDIILDYFDGKKMVRLIVDAKWKLIEDKGLANNDLKQMFAYNILFNSSHAILLYPYTGRRGSGKKPFHRGLREVDLSHSCEIYFLDIFSPCRTFVDESRAEKFLREVMGLA